MSNSGPEEGEKPPEPSLEELFKEIMASSGLDPQSIRHTEDTLAAGLAEAAMGAWSRMMSDASPLERVFLVEILARELASALAPALARALTPDLMAVLGTIGGPRHPERSEPTGAGPAEGH